MAAAEGVGARRPGQIGAGGAVLKLVSLDGLGLEAVRERQAPGCDDCCC